MLRQNISLDFNIIDFKIHMQKAYYLLENSKHQIKTDYLNFFGLKRTVLPNVLEIFTKFDLFGHLA